MFTNMDLVYTSSTPSHGGITSQLLLLQFLNQLRTHYNITTQHTVQAVLNCVHSLKEEERRRKQLTNQHEDDYSKLSADYLNLQNLHLSAGKRIQDLEESLKEYEHKASALEKELEKENLTRMLCERDAKLHKAYTDLEQLNKELHEMRNCSHSEVGKILATVQLIHENQNNGKDIYVLENQLSLTKESLENSTEMYTTQTKKLEEERNKTQGLEEQNAQLENLLRNIEKQQQEQIKTFEAELHTIAEELKMKDVELKKKEEELRKKEEELENKNKELADERTRNAELQRMVFEIHKKHSDAEKQIAEAVAAERSNCSIQLQQKTASEEKKVQEAQNQLKTCREHLNVTQESTVLATKHINKAVEFTNKYRKYLASGNFNFAIAVYGDEEIRDILRASEGIFGKQMTNQEAYNEGFFCGNGRYIPKCFKCDGTDDCGNRNDESNCSTVVFPVGARVVRGEGWKWGNQDGDPPRVGTVTEEVHPEHEGWNRVKWDDGDRNAYRVGAQGKIDLRAAAGYFCGAP